MSGPPAMAEWVMEKLLHTRGDYDFARDFVDSLGGELAGAYEEAMTRRCAELWICPMCGQQAEVKTIMIGVHPYGMTTARETRDQLYCPDCLHVIEE